MLEAFYTFLWMHSWFEGAQTLERLARTAGFDADDPGSASAVALAAAMYRVAIGARLGDDQAAEELGARCLPVLRARNQERELARCLCALGIMAGIGTTCRRPWHSSKRGRRSRERSATGSPRAVL